MVTMGPSILAAAFTTIAAAAVMLVCVVDFFVKFAVVLFGTVVQATLGSFIVFVCLVDTFGPSNPTYTVDLLIAKMRGKDVPSKDRDDKDQEIPENVTSEDDGFESVEKVNSTDNQHDEEWLDEGLKTVGTDKMSTDGGSPRDEWADEGSTIVGTDQLPTNGETAEGLNNNSLRSTKSGGKYFI